MRMCQLITYILVFIAFVSIHVPPCNGRTEASAEENDSDVIKLDEIIISATRTQSSLDRISASSSVVSEKQIKNSTANDLGDLLSTNNIVQMLDYGPGSTATVSLRGASAAQVLVLVDGKRINDSRAGGADLDGISTASVERIEIIRGGQSAIYGADALGGIINIITKKPKKPTARAWSNLGSYGSQSFGLEASERVKSFSGTMSVSRTASKSDFPYQSKFGESLIRKNADFTRRNAFAKLLWDASKSTLLELSASHYFSNSGSPGTIGFYTPKATKIDKTNDLSLNFEHEVTPQVSYKFSAYDRISTMHYIDPTYPYPSDDTHKVDSKGAELQVHPLQKTSFPIVSGIMFLNEDVNSTAFEHRERQTLSAYVQQEIRRDIKQDYLKSISVFPAFRWDYYSDFDAGFSPKIGILASFGNNLSLRANAGKSYRAPTMNDLYWPSSAMTSGNSDLKPERSTDADVGAQIRLSNNISTIRLGGTYFVSNVSDGIHWTPGQNDKWMPINFSKINTSGIETELHLLFSLWKMPDVLSIDTSYTFVDAKDSLGKQLIYRPKHSVGYTVRIGTENLWIQTQGIYQSKRYYTTENTKWLEPFMKHDVQIGTERRIWNGTKLGLNAEIKNILDKKYQLVADYPLPEREWSIKMYVGIGG
ncbi:MAG: TonB-dependent receptor [Candidatus Poribacteria bacterium]|nr:TonB-dependent receptor [Candidatus Poribacteria bacterium]